MGSLCTSSTTNSPPQNVLNNLQTAFNTAQNAASTPYQAYPGQLVAPLNQGQRNAIGNLESMWGGSYPYLQQGSASLGSASNSLANVGNYLQAGSQAGANASNYMGAASSALTGMQGYEGQAQNGLGAAAQYYNKAGGYANNVQQYADAADWGLGAAQNTYGQAANQVGQMGGALGQSANYYNQAAGLATPQQFSGTALAQYMNPYTQGVINSTMANLQEDDAQQREGLTSSAIGSGAYGGDRAGIAQAELARQQDLANNQTVAGLESANYGQALGQFNTTQAQRQQAAGLLNQAGQGYGNIASGYGQGAGLLSGIAGGQSSNANMYNNLAQDQATAASIASQAGQGMSNYASGYNALAGVTAQEAQGFQGLGNMSLAQGGLYNSLGQLQGTTGQAQGSLAGMYGYLGNTASSTGIAQGSAQLQAATVEQQLQQQRDQAAYGQWQNALSYPFQTSSFLTNAATGTGSASGGTQTTNQSPFGAVAGLATSGLGILGATGAFGANGYLTGHALGGAVNGYARGGRVGLASGGRTCFAMRGLAGIAGLGGVNVMHPSAPRGLAQVPLSVRHATRPHFDDGGVITFNPTNPGLPGGGNALGGGFNPTAGAKIDQPGRSTIPGGDLASMPRGFSGGSDQPAALLTSAPGVGVSAAPPPAGLAGGQAFTPNPENKWLGLTMAGLGMMGAGGSGAQAIGRGAAEGLQFYTQLNAADRSNALANSEMGYKQGLLGIDQRKQDLAEKQFNMLLDAQKQAQAALNGTTSPVGAGGPSPSVGPNSTPNTDPTSAPTAAPAPAPTQVANAAPQAPGAMGPDGLLAQADRYTRAANASTVGNPELARTLYQQADNYRTQAREMINTGKGWGPNGVAPLPGATSTEAAMKGAAAGAEAAAKTPYETMEVQDPNDPGGGKVIVPKQQVLDASRGVLPNSSGPVGAGSPPGTSAAVTAAANPMMASSPAFIAEAQKKKADAEAQMDQQFQTRQLSLQRLQTLAKIQQNFQTGSFAEDKANMVAALRSAGIPVSDRATANPAAFQEYLKNATANVFNDVKGMGGRVLVSEIQGLSKSNANAELQPAANAAIIGQGIGAIKYEDQHYNDYMAWRDKNPTAWNASSFERNWVAQNPVQKYVDGAMKDIAYRGQEIPADPAQRVVGQSYMSPTGKIGKWNGSVFVPVAQ